MNKKPSVYVYNSGDDRETQFYYPVNPCLQEIALNLLSVSRDKRPWESYIEEGLDNLKVSFMFMLIAHQIFMELITTV